MKPNFIQTLTDKKVQLFKNFLFLIMQGYTQENRQKISKRQATAKHQEQNDMQFQSARDLRMTVINNQQDLKQYKIKLKKLNFRQNERSDSEDYNKNNESQSTQSIIFIKEIMQKKKEKQKIDAAKQQSFSLVIQEKQHPQKKQTLQPQKNLMTKNQREETTKNENVSKEQFNIALKKARESFQQQYTENNANYSNKEIFAVDYKLAKEQKQICLKQKFKVYFPYEPYQIQLDYINKVITTLENKSNAIIESPTGTGKTICLLSSVLSFVEKEYRQNFNRIKVIYMSRTHSQLSQIQKQLAKTCYRPNMAIFASRQQLCIKQELKFLNGRQKIQACGKGVKLAFKYKGMTKKGDTLDPKIQQTMCKYYHEKEYVQSIQKEYLANKLLNINFMRQKGQQLTFCPYFYPLDVKNVSTLFIMPYNYLLDSYLMQNYKEIIQDSIIIFDEAHNVPDAACDGRSMEIQTSTLETAILELNKILSINMSTELQEIKQNKEKEIKFMLTKMQNLRESFRQFIKENLFSNESSFQQGKDQSESKMFNKEKTDLMLYELFHGPVPDQRKKQFYSRRDYYQKQMKTRILNPLQQFFQYGVDLIQDLKETTDGKSMNFQRTVIFCHKVYDLLKPFVQNIIIKDELEISHYRMQISKKNSNINNSFTYNIRLTCLMPFLTFQDLKKMKPRSIILTSGTLKPLQTWEKELDISFKEQLINDHVIQSEQLMARIIRTGTSNAPLNFSYENLSKNKDKVFKDLVEFVIEVSSRVPNGILLVFPSFKIQGDFKFYLSKSPKRQQLFSHKDVIYEQKGIDFDMKNFKKKAESKKGVILIIICRGKVSEGMDFPDGMCRSVIMVGVPWPNVRDPFIVEKKNHLQAIAASSSNKGDCLRGNQWYTIGTIRAINQALGRVIRHALDYGSIFLVDSRYTQKQFLKEFPSWVSKSLEIVEKVNISLYEQIEGFYKYMGQKYKPKVTTVRNSSFQEPYQQKVKEKPKNAFDKLMKKDDKKKRDQSGNNRNRKREGLNQFDF